MPTELILQPSADAAALHDLREQLATLRTTFAQRESALTQLRATLAAFESRYLLQVGLLYAQLDDLEAQIAEREVTLYDSEAARRRALEARLRAQETLEATQAAAEEPVPTDPPPSLKSLFRDLARRIHPDRATNPEEQIHLTRLMARANHAYSRGDAETLQRLLDDHHELHASEANELHRLERQIHHTRRDLAALAHDRQTLLQTEIAQLHAESEAATLAHRDLLAELTATLTGQIDQAQHRLAFVDRQASALVR